MFLLLASPVLSVAAPQTTDPILGFTPGLTIPSECRKNPIFNACPARLPSGNTLVTATNIVINDITGVKRKPPNILYAGFLRTATGALSESSTITVFDFPSNQTSRKCRFQLISDAGDNTAGRPDVYNIFAFKEGTGEATVNSTWFDKPERDFVIATFTLEWGKIVAKTENEKFLHGFLFGPGGNSTAVTLGESFRCPEGGKVAFEVASAIRNEGFGGGMDIGGNSGLGIGEFFAYSSGWSES
jgi:hypothetical protein